MAGRDLWADVFTVKAQEVRIPAGGPVSALASLAWDGDRGKIPVSALSTPRANSATLTDPVSLAAADSGSPESGAIHETVDDDAYDAPVDDEGRVHVCLRVRPFSRRELGNGGAASGSTGTAATQSCLSVDAARRSVTIASDPSKVFTFDHVIGADGSQEDVFLQVGKPITDRCLAGYNGTIFAYGQTGSGKTYTLQGPTAAALAGGLDTAPVPAAGGGNASGSGSVSGSGGASGSLGVPSPPPSPQSGASRGLMPRVFEYLCAQIERQQRVSAGRKAYLLTLSFLEIYNDRCFDLLEPREAPLALREDLRRGVYVEGLAEEEVKTAAECVSVMRRGIDNRHIGETAMNRESSRSHSVLTLTLQCSEICSSGARAVRTSRFHLVDLAGSERQRLTASTGARLKEASQINRSLSALGKVIMSLVDAGKQQERAQALQQQGGGGLSTAAAAALAGRSVHVHYRDSKLTFLLRDSLGGNALTCIVACASPAADSLGETLSTLQFAQRAKRVRNRATVNEDQSGSVDQLRRELAAVKSQLRLALGLVQTGGPQGPTAGIAGSASGASTAAAAAAAAAALASLIPSEGDHDGRRVSLGLTVAGGFSPSPLRRPRGTPMRLRSGGVGIGGRGGIDEGEPVASLGRFEVEGDVDVDVDIGDAGMSAADARVLRHAVRESAQRERSWLQDVRRLRGRVSALHAVLAQQQQAGGEGSECAASSSLSFSSSSSAAAAAAAAAAVGSAADEVRALQERVDSLSQQLQFASAHMREDATPPATLPAELRDTPAGTAEHGYRTYLSLLQLLREREALLRDAAELRALLRAPAKVWNALSREERRAIVEGEMEKARSQRGDVSSASTSTSTSSGADAAAELVRVRAEAARLERELLAARIDLADASTDLADAKAKAASMAAALAARGNDDDEDGDVAAPALQARLAEAAAEGKAAREAADRAAAEADARTAAADAMVESLRRELAEEKERAAAARAAAQSAAIAARAAEAQAAAEAAAATREAEDAQAEAGRLAAMMEARASAASEERVELRAAVEALEVELAVARAAAARAAADAAAAQEARRPAFEPDSAALVRARDIAIQALEAEAAARRSADQQMQALRGAMVEVRAQLVEQTRAAATARDDADARASDAEEARAAAAEAEDHLASAGDRLESALEQTRAAEMRAVELRAQCEAANAELARARDAAAAAERGAREHETARRALESRQARTAAQAQEAEAALVAARGEITALRARLAAAHSGAPACAGGGQAPSPSSSSSSSSSVVVRKLLMGSAGGASSSVLSGGGDDDDEYDGPRGGMGGGGSIAALQHQHAELKRELVAARAAMADKDKVIRQLEKVREHRAALSASQTTKIASLQAELAAAQSAAAAAAAAQTGPDRPGSVAATAAAVSDALAAKDKELDAARAALADLQARHAAAEEAAAALTAANAKLEREIGQRASHGNAAQKIQHHMRVKQENEQLRSKAADLENELSNIRRSISQGASGSGPPLKLQHAQPAAAGAAATAVLGAAPSAQALARQLLAPTSANRQAIAGAAVTMGDAGLPRSQSGALMARRAGPE